MESGQKKAPQTGSPDSLGFAYSSKLRPRIRISLRGLVQSVFLVLFVLTVVYLTLVIITSLRYRWMNEDRDGDGVALIDDLDPDGDGHDIFSDADADNDGTPNSAQCAKYALSMKHIPYDPLMGKFHDMMGNAGMVVCIDVPVRSWLRAGVSMPALLKQSASVHPEWFEIDPSNQPDNPFFYRRVRNYYHLFEKHPGLVHDNKPQIGDWAFHGITHIALVASVSEDGGIKLVEASPFRMRVVVSTIEEMEQNWGRAAFYGRIRSWEQSQENQSSFRNK